MSRIVKYIGDITLAAVIAAYIGFIGYTFYFHWTNPHYTEMMLFQKFWPHYLVSTAVLIITLELFNKKDK